MDSPLDAPDDDVRRGVSDDLAGRGRQGAGRLGDLAAWLAAARGDGTGIADVPRRARLVLFALGSEATEAPPPVAALADVPSPVAALAETAGVGTGVVTLDPAARAAEALARGAEAADAEIDARADLLLAGALDDACVDAAAAVVASLTGREPVAVVGVAPGRDGRLDDAQWMRRVVDVRDRLRRGRPAGRDPIALLAHAGTPDLAALVGFLSRAAQRRTPVVLDGAVVLAAALLADVHSPGARNWWIAGSRDPDPAARHALDVLGLAPVVDLAVRDGHGAGALTAVCVLRAATAYAGH